MATPLRAVEDGILTGAECEELLYIHRSCSAMGYRPGVQSTHLGHLVASNTGALILPILPVRERIRDLVEAKTGQHCMIFIEFTGLISWTAGAAIGWHHDSNRPYLTQRHYSAVCYLNDYGVDFTGGLFHFLEGESRLVVPQSGRVAIYSAGEENVHSVDPVLSGERCTLTMWFTLDPTHNEDSTIISRLLAPPSHIPIAQSERRDPPNAELAPSEPRTASPDQTTISVNSSARGDALDSIFVQHEVPLPLEISVSMYTSAVSNDHEKNEARDTQRGSNEGGVGQSKTQEALTRDVQNARCQKAGTSGQDGERGRNEVVGISEVVAGLLVKADVADNGASGASVRESGGATWQERGGSGVGSEVQECGRGPVKDLREEKLRELGIVLKKREGDGLLVMEDGEGGFVHAFASSLHALQVAFFCEWQGASLPALAVSGEVYHGMPCPHRTKSNEMKRAMEQRSNGFPKRQRAEASREQEEEARSLSNAVDCNTSSSGPGSEMCSLHVESEYQTDEQSGVGMVGNADVSAIRKACPDRRRCSKREGGVQDAISAWECYMNELFKVFDVSKSKWLSSGVLHSIQSSI